LTAIFDCFTITGGALIGVKVHERGVLPESNIYFHIPKENDRKMFLTLGSSGYYFCNDTYRVVRNNYGTKDINRNSYGSYLCLYIKNGEGYVHQNGRKIVLCKGDAFLLDCHHPHIYGTQAGSSLEMVWVHFDGDLVRNYFKTVAKGTNCTVLKSLPPGRSGIIYNYLFSIYEKFNKQKGVNNILNNKYLVGIMTEFLLGNASHLDQKDSLWDDLLVYISENIEKPLRLTDLAAWAAFSPYHFIRQFKKNIGYTPHHYVLLARIGTASHLLRDFTLSIKEIAHTCGFSNESGFCISFKSVMNTSPLAYRESIR
jgi:AraC-like DNA-binding protein